MNAALVKGEVFGFVMVNVRTDVPFEGIELGEKALVIVGLDLTVKTAWAEKGLLAP